MSQESSQPNNSTLQKQPSSLNRFWESVEKATKTAGKSISHGYVKAKQYSVSKMGVEPTVESHEVIRAFEVLKLTKVEITSLAAACRGMYQARAEYSRQNISFSEAAEQMKVSDDDRLGGFTKELGKVLMSMDMSEQEYLNQLLNQLVIPLERFRDEDIEQVSALKWKYTNTKTEYDYAVNNVIKANKPETAPEKLQDLKQKRDAKEVELNNLRSEFITSVKKLEEKKK